MNWRERWTAAKANSRWWVFAAAGAFAVLSYLLLKSHHRLISLNYCFYACGAAALYLAVRTFIRPRNLLERGAFTLALAVLVLGVLHQVTAVPLARMYDRGAIRAWNMYHYYLGSKYFAEVGYTELYPQTIVADREMKNRLRNVMRLRDMTDYEVRSVEALVPDEPLPAFTPERWEQFKQDLAVFIPMASPRIWQQIVLDRGYNPTPFWNSVGHVFSNAFDIRRRSQLLRATSIDLVLYALMFLGVCWAFGVEPALLVLFCFALLPFNLPRLIGGYIQYDWITAITLGVCFLRKRWPIAAAVSLGYGTMARVFPLILAGGLAFPALRQLLRERRLDKFYWKFAIAFFLFCVAGLGIGSLSNKGFGAWLEWKEKIATHNWEMTFGEGRVGLKHLFTHRLGDNDFEKGTAPRKSVYRRQQGWYYAAAALYLALFLAAVWRRSRLNSALLSSAVFFILLVPSHYYWSILALLPLWRTDRDGPWQPALVPSLTAFLVPAGWYLNAQSQSHQYAQYIRFDELLACCYLVLFIYLLAVNLRDTGLWAKLTDKLPWLKNPFTKSSAAPTGVLLLLLLPLLAVTQTGCAKKADKPRPNILLIIVDTMRADHVGAYGYQRPTTPAIDQLAKEGTVFTRAYSHSPWTMPSVASILTSLTPRDHGITKWEQPLEERFLTLAEYLATHGYYTAAYVSHVIFEPEYHYNQGFDTYDYSVIEKGEPDEISTAKEISDLVVAALEKNTYQPFFMWLHYFDPHNDYLLHEPYNFGGQPMDLYDSEIRFTDEQIGRVFAKLKELKLWDNTVIVVMADHGEEFYEHGWRYHSRTLYEELIHIPLVIRVPGFKPQKLPTIVAESDVAPTLCRLAKLPVPREFKGKRIQYKKPFLSTPRFIDRENRVVFAETFRFGRKQGFVFENWKYIHDLKTSRFEMFDLQADPLEKNNLAYQQMDLAKKFKEQLNAFYKVGRAKIEEHELSDSLKRSLDSLGYLNQ